MRLNEKAGFTLVELMIAIVLSTLLAVGIYRILHSQAQNAGDQATSSQNLRTSQRVRTILSDDIAQAGFDPRYVDLHRNPITPVTAASNDSVTVQSDLNLSGTVGDQIASQDAEIVTYQFDAANNRATRNGTPVLLNVQNFTITYYDANGASASSVPSQNISSLSKIKKIRFEWTQANGKNASEHEELIVNLRNYR